ncbi:MAG: hypothetical protein IRY95_08545 [Clostridia bacterium]|nr:hypothetical protein [Clostridia bacterium]
MAGFVTVSRRRIREIVAGVLPAFPQVVGAYLFGSALDRCRPDSDIDLGLVLAPMPAEPVGTGFLELALEVEARLPRVDGHAFEVHVLRRQAPLFAFEVVSKGLLIYVKDGDAVFDFVEAVARAYGELAARYRRALAEVLDLEEERATSKGI